MNNIHKTLAIAATAVIAGINVWNVQSTSAEMNLLLGDVESIAQCKREDSKGTLYTPVSYTKTCGTPDHCWYINAVDCDPNGDEHCAVTDCPQ